MLESDLLTDELKEHIQFLKLLFGLQPGDLYENRRDDVISLINRQLDKLYADHVITERESKLKSDLQELFHLSYDEMNEYVKPQALALIHQGVDPMQLDVVFTHHDYLSLL